MNSYKLKYKVQDDIWFKLYREIMMFIIRIDCYSNLNANMVRIPNYCYIELCKIMPECINMASPTSLDRYCNTLLSSKCGLEIPI